MSLRCPTIETRFGRDVQCSQEHGHIGSCTLTPGARFGRLAGEVPLEAWA